MLIWGRVDRCDEDRGTVILFDPLDPPTQARLERGRHQTLTRPSQVRPGRHGLLDDGHFGAVTELDDGPPHDGPTSCPGRPPEDDRP